jgi:hypothetical protein
MSWNRTVYVILALTILGQMVIGLNYLWGQGAWLIANVLTLARDFALDRPTADKVKNSCMLAITVGLIVLFMF